MAVERIEEYKQKNGDDILKVILEFTGNFIINYLYCNINDELLARKYNWCLRNKEEHYITAVDSNYDMNIKHIQFHKVKAHNMLGYCLGRITHINGVAFDNITRNLDEVNNQQYHWSKPRRGYIKNNEDNCFQSYIEVGRQLIYASCVRTELDAIQAAYQLELKYEDYRYDFLKDRRKDLDILDMERTGRVSEEEAIYRHVCRYATDNAWYYFRYNLAEYFKDNNLNVPDYTFDSDGFMIHPITGQRLCPL